MVAQTRDFAFEEIPVDEDPRELLVETRTEREPAALDESLVRVSDEPVEDFLIPHLPKRMRARALGIVASWEETPTADGYFRGIISGYLSPEYRTDEGFDRALAAINGHRRRLIEAQNRKNEGWMRDRRYFVLVRGLRWLGQWLGEPDLSPGKDDPDHWLTDGAA